MVVKNRAKMSQFINDMFSFDMRGLDDNRLFALYDLAKQWKEVGYDPPGERLKEKVISGKSLYDLLIEEELDEKSIMFMGSKLNNNNANKLHS